MVKRGVIRFTRLGTSLAFILIFLVGIVVGQKTDSLLQQEVEAAQPKEYIYIERVEYREVPVVEYREIPLEIPVPYKVEVPITKYVEKEVEVIKEVPLELEDWSSLEELKQFLKEHGDELVIYALPGKDGIFQFEDQCVGFAVGLRELAAQYGKNLEIQVLIHMEYKRIFERELEANKYHAVGMAIVSNSELYYIEPVDFLVRLGSYIP